MFEDLISAPAIVNFVEKYTRNMGTIMKEIQGKIGSIEEILAENKQCLSISMSTSVTDESLFNYLH